MRIYIFLLLVAVICVVNTIIYLRTKNAYSKYDDILATDAADDLSAKQFAGDELHQARIILSDLHKRRKIELERSIVARVITFIYRKEL